MIYTHIHLFSIILLILGYLNVYAPQKGHFRKSRNAHFLELLRSA